MKVPIGDFGKRKFSINQNHRTMKKEITLKRQSEELIEMLNENGVGENISLNTVDDECAHIEMRPATISQFLSA